MEEHMSVNKMSNLNFYKNKCAYTLWMSKSNIRDIPNDAQILTEMYTSK